MVVIFYFSKVINIVLPYLFLYPKTSLLCSKWILLSRKECPWHLVTNLCKVNEGRTLLSIHKKILFLPIIKFLEFFGATDLSKVGHLFDRCRVVDPLVGGTSVVLIDIV